ncbi:MAG: dTMP kinase [Candidatus Cloacimonetes bacterium]|jgi:dTMP kinase|nr:dTMP kinase [Candidatus Cloacimonadota bacterium]MDD2650292.1 dTMP kinase [Candidatus Cloacimonadota bacterium]
MNSLFITFEGIEGCGKSTQAKHLYDFLVNQGYEVVQTREPGGTEISEKIRDLILDCENSKMNKETETLLYMASRAQHTEKHIIPALKSGKIVICDRYFDSTLAYQGYARGINIQTIKMINTFASYGLNPDLTFYLDIPVEESMKRIKDKKQDRLEKESEEFHQKVKDGFERIMLDNPQRFICINGLLSISDIRKEIENTIIWKLKEGQK